MPEANADGALSEGWRVYFRDADFTPVGGEPTLRNVTWLHVPKTGSAFENILFRAACRFSTPLPFTTPSAVKGALTTRCPGAFRRFRTGHQPLTSGDDLSTAVTVLRRPSERALSGFFHGLHDCDAMAGRYGAGGWEKLYRNWTPKDLTAYAECIKLCEPRMLNGMPCGGGADFCNGYDCSGHVKELPESAFDEALGNATLAMLDAFAFVGVTDEWERTIWTFAHRFDVAPLPSDFAALRRGQRPARYDVARAIFEAHDFGLADKIYERARARLAAMNASGERAAVGAGPPVPWEPTPLPASSCPVRLVRRGSRCCQCHEHGTAAQRFDPSGGAFGCMPGDPRHFFTTRNCRGLFRCPGGKQVGCNSHGSKRALCECPAPPNASSAT